MDRSYVGGRRVAGGNFVLVTLFNGYSELCPRGTKREAARKFFSRHVCTNDRVERVICSNTQLALC